MANQYSPPKFIQLHHTPFMECDKWKTEFKVLFILIYLESEKNKSFALVLKCIFYIKLIFLPISQTNERRKGLYPVEDPKLTSQ